MKSVPGFKPLRVLCQESIRSGLAASGVVLVIVACATQSDGPPVRGDRDESGAGTSTAAAGVPEGAGAQTSGGSGSTAARGGTAGMASGGVGNNANSGGQGAQDTGGSTGDAGATDAGSSNTTGGTAGGNAGGTGNTAGMSGSGGDTVTGGAVSGGTGGTTGGSSGSAGETTNAGSSGSGGTTGECGEIDCCPDDPDKDDPGACGCGEPDTDMDDDGTLDCEDQCPDDPDKTEPGTCGCGYEDTPECAALKAALVHRYSFNGSGNVAVDSIGDADGLIANKQLSGDGTLILAGGTSNQHVDLPNGIISGFTSVTIEVWLTWNGGDAWQRIFDFGSSDQSEGTQGWGRSYLFLTPMTGDSGTLRAVYTTNSTTNDTEVDAAAALSSSGQRHIAVVVDEANTEFALYVDGAFENSTTSFAGRLSAIQDVNNWIGKSQYSADPELNAVLEEFRIYDSALSDAEIAASYDAGPDAGFLSP